MQRSPRKSSFSHKEMEMKKLAQIIPFFILALVAGAQQPQTQTAPVYPVNAKYTNGVAPGYAPTAGSGLTLNLGGGTVFCNGSIVPYSAGTLTMTASTTNYVYLNTASSCAPAVKTTGFTSADIPIATVVAGSSTISTISDSRTPFVFTPSSSGFTASHDLSGTSSSQTVVGINGVPLCTGFTPTNGQMLQYTTASAPSPCYTAATVSGGSGGSVSDDSTLGGSAPSTSTAPSQNAVQIYSGNVGGNPTTNFFSGAINQAINLDLAKNQKTYSSDGSVWYQSGIHYSDSFYIEDQVFTERGVPDVYNNYQLKSMVDKFIAGASGGNLPIAFNSNSTSPTASFYSGCQTDHTHVTAEAAFLVPEMEYTYWQKSGDLSDFVTNAAAMKTALQNVPLDGTTHLVYVDPLHPWVSWGNQDGVQKTGNDLMGSLLMWRAAKRMAAMYTANGDSANAATMTTYATNIAASLTTASALWDATDGMFLAATGSNNQIDVVGSSFAVYLGFISPAQQTAISQYLVAHYASLTFNGYMRQSPMNWAVSYGGNQCGRGTGSYDDGYWSSFGEWAYYTLNITSPYYAHKLLSDFSNGADLTMEFFDNTGTAGVCSGGTGTCTGNLFSPMWAGAVARTQFPGAYQPHVPSDRPNNWVTKQNFTSSATFAAANIGSLSSNPSALTNGDLWYNTVTNSLDAYINGTVTPLGSPAGSAAPSCATNQLVYYSSSGTVLACLTLGANLSISGGVVNATTGTSSNAPYINSFVGVPETGSSLVASITTGSMSITSGDLVFAFCRSGGSVAVTSILATDSLGDVFTPTSLTTNSTGIRVEGSYSFVTHSGSATFTCTPSASAANQSAIILDIKNPPSAYVATFGASETGTGTSHSFTFSARGSGRLANIVCSSIGAISGYISALQALNITIQVGGSAASDNYLTGSDAACGILLTSSTYAQMPAVLTYTSSAGNTASQLAQFSY